MDFGFERLVLEGMRGESLTRAMEVMRALTPGKARPPSNGKVSGTKSEKLKKGHRRAKAEMTAKEKASKAAKARERSNEVRKNLTSILPEWDWSVASPGTPL